MKYNLCTRCLWENTWGKPGYSRQPSRTRTSWGSIMNIVDQLLAEHEAWRERRSRRPAPPRRRRDMLICGYQYLDIALSKTI